MSLKLEYISDGGERVWTLLWNDDAMLIVYSVVSQPESMPWIQNGFVHTKMVFKMHFWCYCLALLSYVCLV